MGNHNSGRHPNPQHLRELKGEAHLARHNHDEPKPPELDVVKPDTLSDLASVVWDRIAPICLAMRTLTVADVETFKTLCELQATLDESSRLKDYPEDFKAAIRLEKEYAGIIRPYYDYFGMTPFGRAKIRVPKPKAPVSKWAALA